MNSNRFNSYGGGTRERLEIDDRGKSGEERGSNERGRGVGLNGRGNNGRGSRFRGGRGSNTVKGKGKGLILFLIVILGLIVLLYINSEKGFVNLKDIVNVSQEEGVTHLINSTKKLNREAQINSGYAEELPEVYETNNIFDGYGALTLGDKVYLVYVYTLDSEKDELFNLFIESYGKDIPVYPVDINELNYDLGYGLLDHEDSKRFEEPHFIMYKRVSGEESEPVGIYYEDALGVVTDDFNHYRELYESENGWK